MSSKERLFYGSATAIVTPFKKGAVDFDALEKLIDFQISQGTDAIVVLGTTGEAPTVYEKERQEIISVARDKINRRVPLIVGTGSNATSVAVRYSRLAKELGADACLAVTPYYNKATDRGLFLHYEAIAKEISIPIIAYNVPSRTGMTIPIEAYGELSKIKEITAIKEASGNLSYTCELIEKHGSRFNIYTGCDELTLSTLSMGGQGVISVVSNLVPNQMHRLCYEARQGNIEEARKIQLHLLPLIKELFSQVSPIPVKEALSQMGLCEPELRLPLCQSERKAQIESILKLYNLI